MLVAVGYGLIPAPEARNPIDSFSEDSAGKKAFFLLAQELLDGVERSSGSLIPADDGADVLVMLGPRAIPIVLSGRRSTTGSPEDARSSSPPGARTRP